MIDLPAQNLLLDLPTPRLHPVINGQPRQGHHSQPMTNSPDPLPKPSVLKRRLTTSIDPLRRAFLPLALTTGDSKPQSPPDLRRQAVLRLIRHPATAPCLNEDHRLRISGTVAMRNRYRCPGGSLFANNGIAAAFVSVERSVWTSHLFVAVSGCTMAGMKEGIFCTSSSYGRKVVS